MASSNRLNAIWPSTRKALRAMKAVQKARPVTMGAHSESHRESLQSSCPAAILAASLSLPYRGEAMRVLVLTSSYPKFPGDGTAPFIERIVGEVTERGHAVDIVLPRHPQ